MKETVAAFGRLSDNILREQDGAYDTVILGGERLSKAEEFLVGSAATRLVRKGKGGVLVVNPSWLPAAIGTIGPQA